MTQLPVVGENSDIAISFKLELADGTLVEESEPGQPFRFTIGDGTFVSNLEQLLVGLELGTQAKLSLSPERAFGMPDPDNVQTMSRGDFPADMALEVGHVIGFNTPTGEEIPGTVHEVQDDKVLIDFNHPLAGATVIFTVTIEAIYND
ncbi:FKBP-type peptidyl-prolyl cis-trans isomerase [Thiomicrorhabdus sediminis]|uniref:Peptidyl-prolyl cis-trans isomerase n=1 Tax=Thiomicrorhabdus sediminis TaxID=2580412 RepID=A0A4P9K6Z5_9GAMM|nr:peptidylprolyl isomerase [Thiomicrorhabdus sediminis]QCU90017.1 peptidylprolyl isomerase [Thiomicrorhabdus sediminis]